LQAAEPGCGVERLQVVQMRFEESHRGRYSEAAGGRTSVVWDFVGGPRVGRSRRSQIAN
jgi:hypothetical protein